MPNGRVILLVLMAAALAVSVALRLKLEAVSPLESPQERYLYLPSGQYLRLAAVGFDTVLADLFWVDAVLYFGKEYLSTRRYDWLYQLLDVTTTLDPRFTSAFVAGSILLSVEAGQPLQSIRLLEKGMQNIPDDWRLPYFIGFNYFFFLKDPATAAGYLERASRVEGHPAYLPRLAARLYHRGGETEKAVDFLQEAYRNTKDRNVRDLIRKRLEELGAEVEGAVR